MEFCRCRLDADDSVLEPATELFQRARATLSNGTILLEYHRRR